MKSLSLTVAHGAAVVLFAAQHVVAELPASPEAVPSAEQNARPRHKSVITGRTNRLIAQSPVDALQDVSPPPPAPGMSPFDESAADQAVEKPAQNDADEAAEMAQEAEAKAVQPVDPQFIKLSLVDGSVISGKLTVDSITVETTFGTLTVPIQNIKSFRPGIDSNAQLSEQLNGAIENLGSEDFETRESAKKQLLSMGGAILDLLRNHLQGDNVERTRHIKEIVATIEKQIGPSSFDEAAEKEQLVRPDTVVTNEFTVVGKISPQAFEVNSKYGLLNVTIGDIRTASREFGTAVVQRKSLVVTGQHVGDRFVDSGIQVKVGDRISITASGNLVMTPFGSAAVSTPDGAQQYGWFMGNDIPNGALIGRIGNSGSVFKVGSQHTLTADRAGRIQFAVGIQPNVARRPFPGQYDVKVRLDRK